VFCCVPPPKSEALDRCQTVLMVRVGYASTRSGIVAEEVLRNCGNRSLARRGKAEGSDETMPVQSDVKRLLVQVRGHLPDTQQLLDANLHAPPKQRNTARRIFERLRDEHDSPAAPASSAPPCAASSRPRPKSSRECTETFHERHAFAFAFFGGLSTRISYDNSKLAVAKLTAPHERRLTPDFLPL
jgi:hypothetical protein